MQTTKVLDAAQELLLPPNSKALLGCMCFREHVRQTKEIPHHWLLDAHFSIPVVQHVARLMA